MFHFKVWAPHIIYASQSFPCQADLKKNQKRQITLAWYLTVNDEAAESRWQLVDHRL
jgi:hypothetical protein